MSKRRLIGFVILFICSFMFLDATISYGDFVLIYQQSGSQISFLYSKCQKEDKSDVEKDRHINKDFGNWWKLVNPNKSVRRKKRIRYGDEILLALVTPKEEEYYLYGIRESYSEPRTNIFKHYYNIYTTFKKEFSDKEKDIKWGQFKIVNPLYSNSTRFVDTARPIILEYIEKGIDSKRYLSTTTILDDTFDVWYITKAQEVDYSVDEGLVSKDNKNKKKTSIKKK